MKQTLGEATLRYFLQATPEGMIFFRPLWFSRPQKRSTMLAGETKSYFYDLNKSNLMKCWYAEAKYSVCNA